jgi:outer membrane protein TolC
MFLDVLQAQEALFQTQRNLVDSKAELSTDLVALYKALGGGWETEASVSEAVEMQPQKGMWLEGIYTNKLK